MERLLLRQRDIFSCICDILGVCSVGLLARTCQSFNAFIETRRDQQAAWPFVPRPANAATTQHDCFTLTTFIVSDSFSVSRNFSPFSDFQHRLFYPSVVRQCAPSSVRDTRIGETFTVPDGPEMISVETHGLVARTKRDFRMACMISAFPAKDAYIGTPSNCCES